MTELFLLLPDKLTVFVSSMVPIFELRFSIPFGVLALKMSYPETYLLGVIGSIVPAPFILALIPAIIQWMRNTSFFKPLGDWVYNKGMKKTHKLEKYGYIGLAFFVSVPLPGTGVWTGCLAASLLGMEFKKSLLAALTGSAMAGVAVSILTSIGALAL